MLVASAYLVGILTKMELRHLRYFVAVAEEENITKAALRLHVSQPPLSRQIRELEDELGIKLFERTAKSIEITAAGRIFLTEARGILQQVEKALQTVKALSTGKERVIAVGYAPSLTVEILPKALREFEKIKPGVQVQLHDLSTEEMLKGLREKKVDVALTVRAEKKDMKNLVFQKLKEYRVAVAFAPGHPLGKQKAVELKDLMKERLIGFGRSDYPEYHEQIAELCKNLGSLPKFSEEHESVTSLIASVEAGHGVAVVPEALQCLAGPRLIVRPLTPEPRRFVVGALRRSGKNDLVEAFVKSAEAPNSGRLNEHD
jgi:DNA-binding transcriptional LysR family regulator